MVAYFHELAAVWDPPLALPRVPYPFEFQKENSSKKQRQSKGQKQYWKDKDSFPQVLTQQSAWDCPCISEGSLEDVSFSHSSWTVHLIAFITHSRCNSVKATSLSVRVEGQPYSKTWPLTSQSLPLLAIPFPIHSSILLSCSGLWNQ